MKTNFIARWLITVFLRVGLIAALALSGWLIYSQLPHQAGKETTSSTGETALQIILRQPATSDSQALDISVELFPVDIVAVRHEYFTERRAGKRFDDFLNERMNGRKPINARLDKQGQTSLLVRSGNWWLHASFSGEEDLEWQLPVNVAGRKQTVELTSQNVYTRTKDF
ncbi:MAG: hypothetical protein ABR501_00965 [Pyrinomonadaceae bacterium]